MCKNILSNLFLSQKKGKEQIENELIDLCPIDANTLQRLLSGLTEQTALDCDSVYIVPMPVWNYLHKYDVIVYYANKHQAMLTAKGRRIYTKLMSNSSINKNQLTNLITKNL